MSHNSKFMPHNYEEQLVIVEKPTAKKEAELWPKLNFEFASLSSEL